MNNKNLILLCLICITVSNAFSQGCSDAGFCSISGINPSSHLDSTKTSKSQVLFGLNSGIAQFGVFITNPFVQADYSVSDNLKISAKITYALISGSLTSNQGLSDLYITSQSHLSKNLSFISGVKIPFNEANDSKNGYSLPMSYQTTLGTYDYLAGLNYNKSNLLFSIGTQIPLVQNGNGFFVDNFLDENIGSNYISTNKFVRKADLIFRINYRLKLTNEKLKLTIGTMPIYHLQNDEYKDMKGLKRTIQGSKGLTLNLNSVLRYSFNNSKFLDVTVGIPVLSRKRRPDGLSQLALNFQYGIRF